MTLPELPEPSAYAPQMITEDAFTRDQMREYAKECRAEADAEIERLRAERVADDELVDMVLRVFSSDSTKSERTNAYIALRRRQEKT